MLDPQFEATVAEIRGFDLGDDAELLEQIEGRPPEELEGDDWLLCGVLLVRAERDDDALEAFERAVELEHACSLAHYLKSCVLRDAGSMGEALEALEDAREAAQQDGLLGEAELDHAQALLFWRVGNHADALALVERAMARDEESAARWLHRGQLLAELGRIDEARQALERALIEEQDLDAAMYERAALEASAGEVATSAEWLTKAIRLEPAHRDRADDDPRFVAVRDQDAIAALLANDDRPDLRWLDALADWMPPLRGSVDLERLGVSWLGEARSDELIRGLREEYEQGPLGTMHTEATLERSRALLKESRAVATGPGSRTREGGQERCLLFIEPSRPEAGLWLALSESYPPFLWIPVEPTVDALREVLSQYFPRPSPVAADMPACARGFVGYSSRLVVPSPYTGGLEPATIVELDRHLAINPFLESAPWGSAHDDDPWPDEIPDQPGFVHKIAAYQREVSAQARGHVWSLTRRTRHSRSYLSIEVHHQDIFIAQLRYRPSPHAEVIEAMNAYFGCDYPTDLPVDAVGALLGFQFDGAADLESELAQTDSPQQIAGLLYVLSALRHGDLGMLARYRRYARHEDPGVRSTIYDIAVAYNYESLLEEMSLSEPDPEIRAEIEALLDEGIPVPSAAPHGGAPEAAHDVEDEDIETLENIDELVLEADEGIEELDEVDFVLEEEVKGGAR